MLLGSCRAWPEGADQSLLKERSPYVLASWGTVVPLDVSGVALAEHVESALDLDELLPSQDGNLLAGDLECMLRPLLQLDLLNEALEALEAAT